MSIGNNCIGTVHEGGNYYLSRHDGPTSELLAVLPSGLYVARVALAKETKVVWPGGEVTADPRMLYDGPHQYAEAVGGGEHFAHAWYLGAGMLDELPEDGKPRIAFENLRDFGEGAVNPYLGRFDVMPQSL